MEYPDFDERLMTIFEQMLQFNPYFRYPAEELLKSSIFDEIRNPEMEKPAPYRIDTSIDLPGEFDYDALKSRKFTQEDYMKILKKERVLLSKITKSS